MHAENFKAPSMYNKVCYFYAMTVMVFPKNYFAIQEYIVLYNYAINNTECTNLSASHVT